MANKFIGLLSLVILSSCSGVKNYSNAYGVTIDQQSYIKVLGKRRYMAHDPISLIFNGTYKDSVLIPVPSFSDGTIKGESIPTKKGYYSYSGSLMIKGDYLKISLLVNNTDDNKQQDYSWNGEYKLFLIENKNRNSKKN
ncbi:hypothetical protein [Sabulibacter ruber]|uniref:hypothetical protein n=1 Tax=Sabulibacter ruber TaxID=2811901 RepID=UPI001A96BAD2|nr:hypothetical protein [Sabulibacter ruber]